jgi:hypothetical protein
VLYALLAGCIVRLLFGRQSRDIGVVRVWRGGTHLLFRIAFSLPSKYNCRFSIQLMAHDHFLLRGVGNTQTYNYNYSLDAINIDGPWCHAALAAAAAAISRYMRVCVCTKLLLLLACIEAGKIHLHFGWCQTLLGVGRKNRRRNLVGGTSKTIYSCHPTWGKLTNKNKRRREMMHSRRFSRLYSEKSCVKSMAVSAGCVRVVIRDSPSSVSFFFLNVSRQRPSHNIKNNAPALLSESYCCREYYYSSVSFSHSFIRVYL